MHLKNTLFVVGLSLLPVAAQTPFQSVTDDFSDGDDAGWTHYEPLSFFGAGGTFTVTDGAYRIQAAPSPDPGALGPARAGSLRLDLFSSEFQMIFDLLNFDPATGQFVGAGVRLGNIGLGTTTGYVMGYDHSDRGPGIFITRIAAEAHAGVVASTLIPGGLDANKDYRFVLAGDGPNMALALYDLNNLSTPIALTAGSDTTYDSGFFGLVVLDNSGSFGAYADATFDNVFIAIPEPSTLAFATLAAGLLFLASRRKS